MGFEAGQTDGQGGFLITYLVRGDIAEAGYEAENLTDNQMKAIACDMFGAIGEMNFWDALEDACQRMRLRPK